MLNKHLMIGSYNIFMGFWHEFNLQKTCRISDALNRLDEIGFFTAPASIKYHGNYEGGLLDHSLEVTKALLGLSKALDLEWQRKESPIIIGLFHDLCKADSYIRKSNEDWDYNENELIPGHAEKSIILLQGLMDLTEEEIVCIRWHMGAFDAKENWDYYSKAIMNYPNVLWTHTADMVAAKIIGI